MALVCPNCKKDLVAKHIGNVEVDHCSNGCYGIWFDDGELKRINQTKDTGMVFDKIKGHFVPKPKEEAIDEEERFCPRCEIALYRYNWDMTSNIYLDSCQSCGGLWVDSGELKGMNAYLVDMSQKSIIQDDELKAKLDKIETDTINKMIQDKEENVQKLIDWDILFIDDILRFIVKKLS